MEGRGVDGHGPSPPLLSENGFKFVSFFARSESNNNHHKVGKEMKGKGAVAADP